MSHEIRTPLGAIVGFSELGRNLPLGSVDSERYFSIINRNGRILGKLIDDILDLSKVEAGFLEIEKTEFCLRTLIDEVVALLAVRGRENSLALRVTTNGPIPGCIKSDPMRLRQIVTNVLGNSIKFTPRGEVEIIMMTTDERIHRRQPHRRRRAGPDPRRLDAASVNQLTGDQ